MHNDNRPIIHPYAGIALGLLAVSAASIIVKLIQNEHVPSLVISAYRLTLASLALAPLALTRHRDELLKLTRRDLILIAIAGIFLALHFASWIESNGWLADPSSLGSDTLESPGPGSLGPLSST